MPKVIPFGHRQTQKAERNAGNFTANEGKYQEFFLIAAALRILSEGAIVRFAYLYEGDNQSLDHLWNLPTDGYSTMHGRYSFCRAISWKSSKNAA